MANLFAARIYGEVEGTPPFTDKDGHTAFSRAIPFNSANIEYLPASGTSIVPLANGTLMGNTYVYSVIVLPPTGLNVHGAKLASDSSASALATLANA